MQVHLLIKDEYLKQDSVGFLIDATEAKLENVAIGDAVMANGMVLLVTELKTVEVPKKVFSYSGGWKPNEVVEAVKGSDSEKHVIASCKVLTDSHVYKEAKKLLYSYMYKGFENTGAVQGQSKAGLGSIVPAVTLDLPSDKGTSFSEKPIAKEGVKVKVTSAVKHQSQGGPVSMFDTSINVFGWANPGNPFISEADRKKILGGKGAALAEMTDLGLPVPPGFTISTGWCKKYQIDKNSVVIDLKDKVDKHLLALNSQGKTKRLMSVRSGAPVSMPGMMDTILNVGITVDNLHEWAEILGDWTALDCFRRFMLMFADSALGVNAGKLDDIMTVARTDFNLSETDKLTLEAQARACDLLMELVYSKDNEVYIKSVNAQVMKSIRAVFESWNSPRAIEYRKIHKLDNDMGTAVNVQAMVLGNLDDESCSGVLFTRDPSTGENVITGEYVFNAQGEDVVAGIVTPSKFTMNKGDYGEPGDWQDELRNFAIRLEDHYGDMQDIEFTVESGKLYILQTRSGKRTATAAVRIAAEKIEAKDEFYLKKILSVKQFYGAQVPYVDEPFAPEPTATAIGAGIGLACGKPVFSSEEAVKSKVPVILITKETTPNDIAGMNAAAGILTQTGGLTSHAAVVARGMDKPCVVGCGGMEQWQSGAWTINGVELTHDSTVTIDSLSGRVWVDKSVPVIDGGESPYVNVLRGVIRELCGHQTQVRTNKITEGNQLIMAGTWYFEGGLSCLSEFKKALDTGVGGTTLDLTLPSQLIDQGDKMFLSLGGPAFPREQEMMDDIISDLIDNPVGQPQNLRIRMRGMKRVAELKKAGYTICTEPNSMSDIMNAKDKVFYMNEKVKNMLFPTGGLVSFQNMMAKAGHPVAFMDEGMTFAEMVQKVLG